MAWWKTRPPISGGAASFWEGPFLTTVVCMLLHVVDRHIFPMPASPAFLVIFVTFSAFRGGMWSGCCSAVLAWVYVLIHFSVPEHLFDLNYEGSVRVATWAFVYPLHAAMTGILRDRLTRRIEAERELAGKMIGAAKMSALGEMAGGVAHEINNPLSIVTSGAALLQTVLTEPQQNLEMIKELVQKIDKASRRVALIVRALRSFSRDGSKDPFVRVGVEHLIDETITLCGARMRNAGITLSREHVPGDLVFVGREVEVSQVLMNLLNNAFDAIEGQEEKWIRISATSTPDWVEIRVTDSGRGIPVAIQQKIFQPFFSTKEIGRGVGMGLSVSLGIVQSNGGELWLDSASSHTSFVIRLPRGAFAPNEGVGLERPHEAAQNN